MPVRFTCRLIAVRTQGELLRVQYGPLSDAARLIVFRDVSRLILPPDDEMTDEQVDAWAQETLAGTGGEIAYEQTAMNAALVEAKRTYEDAIPPGSVRAVLRWTHWPQSGEPTLGVEVTNEWGEPIPEFSLAYVYKYDALQEEKMGRVKAQMMGGSLTFFERIAPSFLFQETVAPGATVLYALQPPYLPTIQNLAASLSSESHRIALCTGGREFDHISGSDVATLFDTPPTA